MIEKRKNQIVVTAKNLSNTSAPSQEALIYKALVITPDNIERYIGSTVTSFKPDIMDTQQTRDNLSQRDREKDDSTTLSTYFWKKAGKSSSNAANTREIPEVATFVLQKNVEILKT